MSRYKKEPEDAKNLSSGAMMGQVPAVLNRRHLAASTPDLPGIAPDERALADAGTDRPDGLPPWRFGPYRDAMGSKKYFIRHARRLQGE